MAPVGPYHLGLPHDMDQFDHDIAIRRRLLNLLQSVLLLGGMAALAAVLGWMLFGPGGVVWTAAVAALTIAFAPSFSPRWVLRLTGAWEIAPWQAPEIYDLLGKVSARAGLKRAPRLFYVPTRVLNAFAAGSRDDAAIALSDGLLRTLDVREILGVLAHEVAHLRANDIWVMTLADVVGRLTSIMSFVGQVLLMVMLPVAIFSGYEIPLLGLAVVILAPLMAVGMQLALSRTREYDADLFAAELTGDPEGLDRANVHGRAGTQMAAHPSADEGTDTPFACSGARARAARGCRAADDVAQPPRRIAAHRAPAAMALEWFMVLSCCPTQRRAAWPTGV